MPKHYDSRTSEQRNADARLAQEHLKELYGSETSVGYKWLHDAQPNQVEYFHAIAPRQGLEIISKQGSFEVRNGQIIEKPDLTIILARRKRPNEVQQ